MNAILRIFWVFYKFGGFFLLFYFLLFRLRGDGTKSTPQDLVSPKSNNKSKSNRFRTGGSVGHYQLQSTPPRFNDTTPSKSSSAPTSDDSDPRSAETSIDIVNR